jgi:mono/diheme cytochrome c family protein
MKTNNSNIFLFAVLIAILFLSYTTITQDKKPWVIPDNVKKMKNPVKADDEAINIGKGLYAKHCKSCHGKNGEGDGTKAAELKTSPGDFTSADFQKQTDGELYFKTTQGREDMPEFKKKIASDEDRWMLVHYLRTLKAK